MEPKKIIMKPMRIMPEIPVKSIQPSEEFLTENLIRRLLKNPKEVKERLLTVSVFHCPQNKEFQYFVVDRNHTLYAAHKLGIQTIIPLSLIRSFPLYDLTFTQEVYDLGIRSWDDFDTRLLPEEERSRIYEKETLESLKEFQVETGINLRELFK